MSSGAHLSKGLHDFIRTIGETRSKQEEDKLVSAELEKLKVSTSNKLIDYNQMKENLLKAIYIDMLGQDTTFAHIHALNLTQSRRLSQKRIGYLCCSLFLGEGSELLILLICNLQKDLQSASVIEIATALGYLAKAMNQTFIDALAEQVLKHLGHPNELVRKKALLVVQRMCKVNASYLPTYFERLRRALSDRDPSIVGVAVTLFHEACRENPDQHKQLTSTFVLILKQVIEHKFPREFDYHRIPAPWI